jgi:hypothetical protein
MPTRRGTLFHPTGASPKFAAEAPRSDDPCIQHYRLAAIDIAHRQSRQLVLSSARTVATTRHTRCLKGTEK